MGEEEKKPIAQLAQSLKEINDKLEAHDQKLEKIGDRIAKFLIQSWVKPVGVMVAVVGLWVLLPAWILPAIESVFAQGKSAATKSEEFFWVPALAQAGAVLGVVAMLAVVTVAILKKDW